MALALIAGCGGGSSSGGSGASSSSGSPTKSSIPGVVTERALSRNHRSGHVDYPGPMPPTGGDHAPIWLNCGFYSTPQPLENTVHDLEHGAVWIAYEKSASAADIAKIRTLAKHDHVVATPFDDLASPFVLAAWEHRLPIDSIDDPRVQEFIDAFSAGQAAPEKGASCSGGVGNPG
jgi:hypothetical protein